MGWNGSGSVTLLYDWSTDRDAGAPDHFIDADKFDSYGADLAGAIEATLNRNGENAAAANIGWGGFKITNLGDPTLATDAINASSVAENTIQFGGTTTGSAGAYTVTNGFLTTVAAGTRLLCIANHTNAGAATMQVNAGGATAIVRADGTTALSGSEIVSGDVFEVVYDGTSWVVTTGQGIFQPLDADLTSWAAVTRAANFDTFVASPSSSNLAAVVSDETGNGALVFANTPALTTPALTTPTVATSIAPASNDSASVGVSGTAFSDLFLANGGTIDFNASNVVVTHSTGVLNVSTGTLQQSGEPVLSGGQHTIWVPATAMMTAATNGAASGAFETTTNAVNVTTFDFDTTTEEYAQFAIQMPKSWDEGTVVAQAVWSHPSTTVNFGVVWGISAVAFADSDALDTAFGTEVTMTDTGGTTDDVYISPESGAITIAGTPAAEEYVVFNVARVVANGSDDMAVDARLHGIKIHYTIDAANDA